MRRRIRSRRTPATASLLAATLGALAVGSTPAVGAAEPDPRAAAFQLYGRAADHVSRRYPACRPTAPRRDRPQLVEGGAGAQVASVFGIFRRPATPEEQAEAERQAQDADSAAALFGGSQLPRDGVRIVRSSSGRKVVISALTQVPPAGPERSVYDRCAVLVRKRITALAHTVSLPVLAAARRVARLIHRSGRPPANPMPSEGLVTEERALDGRSGGGGGVAPFRARNLPDEALLSMRDDGRRGLRLTLLVADGVATVEFTFVRAAARGRPRSVLRRTFTARDNVVFGTVPRMAPGVFPRLAHRDASDRVIRRTGP